MLTVKNIKASIRAIEIEEQQKMQESVREKTAHLYKAIEGIQAECDHTNKRDAGPAGPQEVDQWELEWICNDCGHYWIE